MRRIKVAGAELNQTPLDWDRNLAHILEAIKMARAQQVDILCLPELCITGYGCEDAFFSPSVQRTAVEMLQLVAASTQGMVVCVGLPLAFRHRLYNTAAVLADGAIVGFVGKRYLAGMGIHYEPRWFTPWPEGLSAEVGFEEYGMGEECYPLGDLCFDIGGVRLGFEICEDAWSANRPGRRFAAYGIDLILNPSASHFAFAKLEVRKRFVLEGARAFGTGYVYANLLGNEAGRAIYDGGVLIALGGTLLAESERLTFADVQVTAAVLDLDETRLLQSQASALQQTPEEVPLVRHPFRYHKHAPVLQHPQLAAWERSPYLKEEEFARAEMLGLFDYMRKSYSKGFVLSLSGGADSSAIASLIYLMAKKGVEALGLEGFKKKLSYFRELQDCKSAEEMMPFLLTTAYQPTENSGEVTRNAAEQLALALHATHYLLDVDSILKGYQQLVAGALGRPLSWEQDDLALQNIQARVRAPSVWMLANIRGALLLSTSNRSEAAVGYATMDGDTSGGLSPIAGIDKAYLRRWLLWLQEHGMEGQLRIPALSYVNEQQPTAELRPKESGQTDEADLMPYDLLDDIEGAAIRDKKSPVECYELLKLRYPQYAHAQLKEWVAKFFRLWSRNQWKRERYAPSFHLDDKNLDPKTWCRFPILSGGFARELKALEQA